MTSDVSAKRIFLGGPILTMERSRLRVEAVAIGSGRVLAADTEREVLELRGPRTTVTELGERALLPGFVDGHGHLAKLAASLGFANLAPPPVGPVRDIDGLVDELRRFGSSASDGSWIVGRGYDQAFMTEGRHPTREDLDRVSRTCPIYVTHVSSHLAVASSLALQLAGITAQTADPPGGVIRRDQRTGAPTGLLEESALRLVWCAVERRTRSGVVLGSDQTISTMAALRSVTIDAAYAHFEDDAKGSIVPGKLADLVMLGTDPTQVPSAELAEVQVVETIEEAVTVYQAGSSPDA